MKEKINDVKHIFENLRDKVESLDLSEFQHREWLDMCDKLEELIEELEFLSEDLV